MYKTEKLKKVFMLIMLSFVHRIKLLEEGKLQKEAGEVIYNHTYNPVQSLSYDHGVSFIPLPGSPHDSDFTIGHHELQV